MKDNLHINQTEKLLSGIKKISDAVAGTMGTGGKNAIIECIESPHHMLTNDGYSIANSIWLEDPIENIGKNILLESINRANKSSGDGSSTTCVLTSAIIEEGVKHLAEGSSLEIKRSLEACMPLIEASIAKQSRAITVDEVGKVASISAEDEQIGALIQEIWQKIGKDGIINWDISKTTEDSYTIGNGITVEGAGFVSPYLCDIDDKTMQPFNVARVKNPKILITKTKIVKPRVELDNLFASLNADGVNDIVIFCDEIDPLAIPPLVETRVKKGFRAVIVKMPVLWKDEWFGDLALASGASIVDGIGLKLHQVKKENLGTFENISVYKDSVFIDGIKDLTEHVKELQDGDDQTKLRASRLNTKTARLFIGAQSESALSYKRLKVEDAIGASYNALKGGIVAGGGSALVSVTRELPATIGGKILSEALLAPAKQIAANVGMYAKPGFSIGDDYLDGRGFDTKSKTFVNMFDAGIIDPTIIVLNAVKNAISVAAAVLTANTIVTLPREVKDTNMPNNAILR